MSVGLISFLVILVPSFYIMHNIIFEMPAFADCAPSTSGLIEVDTKTKLKYKSSRMENGEGGGRRGAVEGMVPGEKMPGSDQNTQGDAV